MTRPDPAGLVAGGLLLVLAGVVGFDGYRIEGGSTYGMGPGAVPLAIAAGLALLGIANAAQAFVGGLVEREPLEVGPVLLIGGGFVVLVALIAVGGGFILGSTVLFAATARAFGRRALLVDLAIGFGLALAAYLLFAKGLTLSLPAGPLERLI